MLSAGTNLRFVRAGRTITSSQCMRFISLKIQTANWKDICIDKKRNDHSYWQSTWKTVEQDRYIMCTDIPIQIDDLRNHHIIDHPVQLLGKLPIIKLSFKLNNYITPKEFIFTWGKLSKLYIWFSQWPLLLFKHSPLFLTWLFPSQ